MWWKVFTKFLELERLFWCLLRIRGRVISTTTLEAIHRRGKFLSVKLSAIGWDRLGAGYSCGLLIEFGPLHLYLPFHISSLDVYAPSFVIDNVCFVLQAVEACRTRIWLGLNWEVHGCLDRWAVLRRDPTGRVCICVFLCLSSHYSLLSILMCIGTPSIPIISSPVRFYMPRSNNCSPDCRSRSFFFSFQLVLKLKLISPSFSHTRTKTNT